MTQLDFAKHELTVEGRTWALEPLKNAKSIDEAAEAFLIKFETPWVVVNWLDHGASRGPVDEEAKIRADRGRPFLKAYYAEVGKQKEKNNESHLERLAEQGPGFSDGVKLTKDFYYDRDKFLTSMKAPGNRVQCTAFVSYFTNRYVLGSRQEGHGKDVADLFDKRSKIYEMTKASDLKPYTIFSMNDGGPGHTGIILSTEADGSIIVVEANVKNDIRHSSGIIAFKSFGNKKVENTYRGQVNVERWKSFDAWKAHWEDWGFHSFEFASPDDPEKIAKTFKEGSRF